jgi:plastocyanin
MRRGRARIALSGVLICLLGSVPVQAGIETVNVVDTAFQPDETKNQVGDTVQWTSTGTTFPHNVREDGMLFRNGVPSSAAFVFDVVFSAGSFHYYCEVHGSASGGMDGFVRIPARITPEPDGALAFTVQWATDTTETGSVYDVQFRVGSGDWRNWRRNTASLGGVFGKSRKPVRVRDGVRYSFRARSQEGQATSGWSPVRSFRP